MDEELVGLIRDSLTRLEDTCHGIREDIREHVKEDAEYWKRLDRQDGQISMLKLIGAAVAGGVAVWEGVKSVWR